MIETKTPVVKFSDLEDHCLIRTDPFDQTKIALATADHGRPFSRPSVHSFFQGTLKTAKPAFKVIRKTIEETLGILIDFSESNYNV